MICPHCKHLAQFQILHRTSRNVWSDDAFIIGYMSCSNCGRPVALLADEKGNVTERWPLTTSTHFYPDVPTDLAAVAIEASRCLSAQAPRAAVAMARAVVEAVAKDKHAQGGNLMRKIDASAQGGHISEAMKEAAHEIRFAGNAAVHVDPVAEAVSQEEAEEIVELMSAILNRVSEEPAQIARVRARREAREQGNPLRASARRNEVQIHIDPPAPF